MGKRARGIEPLRSLGAALLVFGGLASQSNAAMTVTATGTITDNWGGPAFSIGETVTVTFTLAEGIGAPNVANTTGYAEWATSTGTTNGYPSGSALFTDLSISGATGSYDAGSADHDNVIASGYKVFPNTFVRNTALYLGAYENAENGMGLAKGGEDISFVDVALGPDSFFATSRAGDASVTPESVFVNGTYDTTSSTGSSIWFGMGYNGGGNWYQASLDSVTISGASEVSAVPEPGQNLGLLALGAGGLLLRRRAKRAA